MKLILPKVFGQREPPWKDKKLGTSTVTTIGSHGCLLTSVSMVCCYHGKDTDPLRLNDDLVRVKGFYQGNLLVYGSVTDIYPEITVDWARFIDCAEVPAPLDTIYKTLDEGLVPILKVDSSPASGLQEHWVIAIGYDDTTKELIVFDPWDKAEYFFTAKYGDPKTKIYRIVVYKGPITVMEETYSVVYKGQTLATYERNPIDQIETLNKELEGAKTNLSQEIQNNAALQAALTNQEKDNAELLSHIREVERQRDDATADLKEIKGFGHDLLGIDIMAVSEMRSLSKSLQELTAIKKEYEDYKKAYEVLINIGKFFLGRRNDGKGD